MSRRNREKNTFTASTSDFIHLFILHFEICMKIFFFGTKLREMRLPARNNTTEQNRADKK